MLPLNWSVSDCQVSRQGYQLLCTASNEENTQLTIKVLEYVKKIGSDQLTDIRRVRILPMVWQKDYAHDLAIWAATADIGINLRNKAKWQPRGCVLVNLHQYFPGSLFRHYNHQF